MSASRIRPGHLSKRQAAPGADAEPRRGIPPARSDASEGSDPIGSALSHLHEAVTAEPLPTEFLDLIAEIDRAVAKRDPK